MTTPEGDPNISASADACLAEDWVRSQIVSVGSVRADLFTPKYDIDVAAFRRRAGGLLDGLEIQVLDDGALRLTYDALQDTDAFHAAIDRCLRDPNEE